MLSQAQQSLKAPQSGVFFPDARGVGYYRFALPKHAYEQIVAQIESALTPEERISLLGDEWAGVRSNHDPVGDYLNLAAAVKDDQNAAVIATATEPLSAIESRIATTPEEKQAIAAWAVRTFKPAYQRLGAPAQTDTPDKKELRAALFDVLGSIGRDPEVIAEARQITTRYLSDPSAGDATLAQTAGAIAAENGDAAFFDQLQQIYETSNNPQIQESALRLLARFRNPELQRRALAFAVSGKVRNQDSVLEMAIALRNPATHDVAWDFLRNNWSDVQKQFTTMMGPYLVSATGSFCTAHMRDEVLNFFTTHQVPASGRSLPRVKDNINACIALRADQEPKLKEWVAGQQSQPAQNGGQ